MKKLLVAAVVTAVMLVLTGCGTGFPNGLVYTQLNLPVVVNNLENIKESELDQAEAVGYKAFGLFVWGDTSYGKVVQDANLSVVQRIEYFSYDICGCGYFGIRVYGLKNKWKDDSK